MVECSRMWLWRTTLSRMPASRWLRGGSARGEAGFGCGMRRLRADLLRFLLDVGDESVVIVLGNGAVD